jgi:hypothetical protein
VASTAALAPGPGASQATPVHELTVRVRYNECGMQGHVFNGHCLTWFDMAYTDPLSPRMGGYQVRRSEVADAFSIAVASDEKHGLTDVRLRRPSRPRPRVPKWVPRRRERVSPDQTKR